ncbi:hypothetical protein KDK77_07830 [bacterium]|nr:hypothetical protein [bacterium]
MKEHLFSSQRLCRGTAILFSLLFLFAAMIASYHLRITIWGQQEKSIGQPLCFTLESALLFRYARLSLTNDIPVIDKKVEYPYGVEPRKFFSLGGDIILGKAYKMFSKLSHSAVSFEVFHRYAVPFYFVVVSLSALFFIGIILTGKKSAGLIMACMYGISIPGVLRSTGQEFMRENFALALLFVHSAFLLSALKNNKKYSYLISGIVLAVAWALWDMIHLYMSVLAVFFVINPPHAKKIAGIVIPCAVISLVNPYLSYHKGILSFPMLVMTGLCCYQILVTRTKKIKKLAWFSYPIIRYSLLFGLVPLCLFITPYGDAYNHFWELLCAKIRFLNCKPLNPEYLTFDARVLWTPALHSASFEQLCTYFCCIISIAVVSIGFLFYCRKYAKLFPTDIFIIFGFIFFLILYIFFVRMVVFAAFFGVLMISFWFKLYNKLWNICAVCILLLLCCGEYSRTYSYSSCMGRNVDYASLRYLLKWIQENTQQEDAILASFELSGPIINYAGRPIILQPKFEAKSTRNKYQRFIETLFEDSEDRFAGFMTAYDARYFVFQKGTSWNKSIYAPAYFSAKNDEELHKSVAYRFERRQKELMNFVQVYENGRYKVFRRILSEEKEYAKHRCEKAEEAIANADYGEAERLYREALAIYPALRKARMKLGTVLWLSGKTDEARLQWNTAKTISSL